VKRPYIRKTRDEYDIQQLTAEGWETVCTVETWYEAQKRVKEYRTKQPSVGARWYWRRNGEREA